MPAKSLLAALVLGTISVGANAGVICEFEPSQDWRDCSRCYKATNDGTALVLAGEVVSTSPNPNLFPAFRSQGKLFQKGGPKQLTDAGFDAFEVCYVDSKRVIAPPVNVVLDQGEGTEITLRVANPDPLKTYTFEVVGADEGLMTGLFGDRLAVMPGGATGGIRYVAIDNDGVRSEPAIISVVNEQELNLPQVPQEVVALAPKDIAPEVPVIGEEPDAIAQLKAQIAALQSEQIDLDQLEGQIQFGMIALQDSIEIAEQKTAELGRQVRDPKFAIALEKRATESELALGLKSGPTLLANLIIAEPESVPEFVPTPMLSAHDHLAANRGPRKVGLARVQDLSVIEGQV